MEHKIWFTSDLHFGHSKNFLWKPRGFNSNWEHDKAIIANWNEVVNPEDEVYVLGDLMLEDNCYGLSCIKQLKGQIHVILGNHDTVTRQELYNNCYNIISIDYALEIKLNKNYFWLSHYPTITANYDDDKPWAKHLINLFGHTHQTNKFYTYNDNGEKTNPYMYNVGLDAHNNYPVSLEQVIEDIKEMKMKIDREEK